MALTLEDRLKAFTYRVPTQEALDTMTLAREAFQDFVRLLDQLCAESREKSLAFTALEACGMWTMKAITHNDPACVEASPHPAEG